MSDDPGNRRRRRRELGLLALIVIVYAGSLGRTVDHDYVWDDIPELAQNAAFDRPLLEGMALTQTERAAPELAQLQALAFGYDSYRPLLFASYWVDIAVWGRRPGPLHATNVLFGALAIVLAYATARRWLGSAIALVPTAVFALHPVQIEAVAYLSGRGDVLAGLFALLATYAALRACDTGVARRAIGWTALAAVAFAASLLTKESAIGLPVAIGVVASRPGGRARWWVTGVIAAVAIAYLPLRAAMVETATAPPIADAVIAAPGALVEYVRIVLLPFDLSIERLPHGHVALGWGAIAVVAIGAGLMWRRASGETLPAWTRAVLAGLAWFAVLLGPSLVVVTTMHVLADRYVYLPLFGLSIALAAGGQRLATWRPLFARPLAIAVLAWGALLLVVAWRQVPVWRDVTSLYTHAAAMAPDSSRAQYRLAVREIAADRWDHAVPLLERAIELDPRNVEALNNLGVFHLRAGRFADAEALLRRAVAANPARFNSWVNLGLAQVAGDQRAEGCRSVARALQINPRFAPAHEAHALHCTPP